MSATLVHGGLPAGVIIDDRYGVRDCEVPSEYRQGPVRAARAGK